MNRPHRRRTESWADRRDRRHYRVEHSRELPSAYSRRPRVAGTNTNQHQLEGPRVEGRGTVALADVVNDEAAAQPLPLILRAQPGGPGLSRTAPQVPKNAPGGGADGDGHERPGAAWPPFDFVSRIGQVTDHERGHCDASHDGRGNQRFSQQIRRNTSQDESDRRGGALPPLNKNISAKTAPNMPRAATFSPALDVVTMPSG